MEKDAKFLCNAKHISFQKKLNDFNMLTRIGTMMLPLLRMVAALTLAYSISLSY